MDPISGGGLGLLKYLGDVDANNGDKALDSVIARYSPWTGQKPGPIRHASFLGDVGGGALAGMQAGQGPLSSILGGSGGSGGMGSLSALLNSSDGGGAAPSPASEMNNSQAPIGLGAAAGALGGAGAGSGASSLMSLLPLLAAL